jgi:hypothetical protein
MRFYNNYQFKHLSLGYIKKGPPKFKDLYTGIAFSIASAVMLFHFAKWSVLYMQELEIWNEWVKEVTFFVNFLEKRQERDPRSL